MRRRAALRVLAALVALPAHAAWTAPLAGQSTIEVMVDECAGVNAEFRMPCEDAALVLQSLQGGVGLLMSAGGALPASPSTAGLRLMGSPRVIVDAGLSVSNFRYPAPGRAMTGVREERETLLGARLVTTVGVFEGFSPMPTVGGVLGLDLVGSLGYHRLPSSVEIAGLPGGESSIWAWGGGVRVGLLRESFSLPGVTVTALHRRGGRFTHRTGFDDPAEQFHWVEATYRPRVTTVRGEVGKDLLAVGITAGMAWDRYSGEGVISAWWPAPNIDPPPRGTSTPSDFNADRTYFFLGANFTWVVLQAAGEIGWAGAPSRWVDFEGSGPTRPDARSLQGALTLRITY